MYKISFYVPKEYLEDVKETMFAVGAGRIGNYERCAWQVLGEGQFSAMQGSQPFFGEINQLEKSEEYKVEMVCEDHLIEPVMAAFKQVHPYEEPAYSIIKIADF